MMATSPTVTIRFCKNCRIALQRSGIAAAWVWYEPTRAMHAYALDTERSICHAVTKGAHA